MPDIQAFTTEFVTSGRSLLASAIQRLEPSNPDRIIAERALIIIATRAASVPFGGPSESDLLEIRIAQRTLKNLSLANQLELQGEVSQFLSAMFTRAVQAVLAAAVV